jgi:cell division protein FtsI/penicillin-binding protein 2
MVRESGDIRRITILAGFLFVCLGLLVFRLASISIRQTDRLSRLAVSQHGQRLALELPRGQIFDRNDIPLTDSASELNLVAFPSLVPEEQKLAVALQISSITGLTPSTVRKQLSGRLPVVLARRINSSQASETARMLVPGVMALPQKLRYQPTYPAAHVIGYVRAADNVGISGIELKYDNCLREGSPHTLSAILDAKGKLIPGLGFKVQTPQKSENLGQVTLTIDESIQNCLERAMSEVRKGAGVALDPKTGEVLAMVSKPSYKQDDISEALNDPDRPLINRALYGFYPGSVFKLVTAAAALESGKVQPYEEFYDPGYFQVSPSIKMRCSNASGHGQINFLDAISKSCNTVFIDVALRLGRIQ